MEIEYLMIIIGSLLLSVVYQLVFLDFFDCLYLRKHNANIAIFIIIVLALLSVIVQRTFYIEDSIMYILQILLLIVGFKWIYHINWLISIYLAFMARFYIYAIAGIVLSIKSLMTGIPITILYYDRQLFGRAYIIARIVTIIAFVIVKQILMKPNRGRELIYPKTKLYQIIFIQLLMSFIVLATMAMYGLELNALFYLAFFVTTIVINFFVSKLTYQDALNLTEMNGVYEYSSDLKYQIVRQAQHYDSFRDEIERFKKFDHDYQSMLMVLESLLGNLPSKETNAFINGFVDEIKRVQELNNRFSNNVVVDALLTEMSKICKLKKINFEAKVYLDDRIPISSFDIVRIANNLLKNAIEANMKLEEQNRWIKISSKSTGEWSVFSITNAYNGHLNKEKEKILTSKLNSSLHGNGLNIVKELVEKMDGVFIVEPDEQLKIFTVKVILKFR